MIKFVELNGRLCRVCDQKPRFFHENDDGSVTCCGHSCEHDEVIIRGTS